MVKWTEEHKTQMLLAIIEHLNPTSLPWEKISSAMGPDFSTEAVRQQYKNIKKGFKTTTTSSSSSSATASTSPQSAKDKPSTTKGKKATPASGKNGTAKGRKRKAAEISINDDDEEEVGIKTESSATGLPGQVFKAEPLGDGAVDLENDALYSAA